jgi:hypothetical protein
MRSFQRIAGLVLVGTLLAGCVPLVRTMGSGEGDRALNIEGPAGDGEVLRLRDQRGKVVLLCFWHGN